MDWAAPAFVSERSLLLGERSAEAFLEALSLRHAALSAEEPALAEVLQRPAELLARFAHSAASIAV